MGYSPDTLVFRDSSGRVETIVGASTVIEETHIRVTRLGGDDLDMPIDGKLDGKKIVNAIFAYLCNPDRRYIDLLNPETRKKFRKAD